MHRTSRLVRTTASARHAPTPVLACAPLSHREPAAREPAAADRRPQLAPFLRDHLGRQLRTAYAAFVSAPHPSEVREAIARLEAALAGQPAVVSRFRDDLLAALPALRGFALSLTANVIQADDLVQETMLRAWQNQHRFEVGTNLKAWLFTILRNQFYTNGRRRRREVEDADGAAAAQLVSLPAQEDGVELREVWAELGRLPAAQREALLLVAMHGMTYEAAAELMNCQVGTAKSRVNRARAALAQALGYEAGRPGRAAGP
ncbi:RNA polymerase, sigma-24 subunit, ECF subfamily [Methylobacterium sp. 4-46]|uniref:sigma-70 family RNA polymerase sigma factor n=1 Tax=unclassified Methylobacterium TaxID=2615210 RepID=UPI000165CA4B|nr:MULTISPECIES: sigma-70 family RNA polymerase sigma factor [Methylobacterium]ACA15797.1 RNA polymerase, sigma-24 subunit, ECF subfamily [Methylobacterium sp. 4-46]WFT83510.1 sigma-70 family RNA polymerase sigma factor [Methylobacterium nodulans]